jgi:hypothetical protein
MTHPKHAAHKAGKESWKFQDTYIGKRKCGRTRATRSRKLPSIGNNKEETAA